MTDSESSLSSFFSTDRARGLLGDFETSQVPQHVAVIMDGNGRWATERGLPRLAGHKAGAQAVKELIAASIELGIGYLTIYSFSSENWKRPVDEVSGLMRLFVEVLEREVPNLEARHVRVIVLGDLAALPAATRSAFERVTARTAGNTGLTLAVALNYGGRDEILSAVRALARAVEAGSLAVDRITEDAMGAELYTAGLPDPDLVIRTSGEQRLSNFLPWQSVYSELYFTDVLWPDFNRDELLAAVVDFQRRARRFGAAS